jgi:acid phosphatase type 7
MERSEMGRTVALGVVAFAATLIVLAGLVSVVGRAPAPTGSPSGSPAVAASPTVAATPAQSPTGSPAGSAGPSPTDDPASPSAAASPEVDPVLVGAGDIAGCDWDEDDATASLLDGIEGTIFTAGDNVYPAGTSETFAECFDPAWGRHLGRIRPAPGNHDWETGTLDAYLAYFGAAAVNDEGDPWYAFDLGTWQVIVLDSDCSRVDGCAPDSPQGRWLSATLADSDARCTLAIWHHPRFSSGTHGNDPSVGPFWDALHAAGADVVVNGHEHDYERFAPMAPDGTEDRDRGLRQFIVGTGGVELREFGDPAPNSELRVAVSHGVIAFTLRDGSYDWRWIPTTGDVTDQGTATCH